LGRGHADEAKNQKTGNEFFGVHGEEIESGCAKRSALGIRLIFAPFGASLYTLRSLRSRSVVGATGIEPATPTMSIAKDELNIIQFKDFKDRQTNKKLR